MDHCLLCLEEINRTDKLLQPSHCSCKVSLHVECLKQIELTGLLCPICRIKKSQNRVIRIVHPNENSYLMIFANKVFEYFAASPNYTRFILFILASFMVTFSLIPSLIFHGIQEPKYRSTTLTFIGITFFIIFQFV